MRFYIAKMVIPGKSCGCHDAKIGTKLRVHQWLCGKWTVNGITSLTFEDLENTKYFEACNN